MLPVPTVAQLAGFTGRPENTFGAYAAQALAQAALLLGINTALTALPDDADHAQLAVNAILEMADRLYLDQPYALDKARPFVSESTLDYSYSKGGVAAKAKNGQPTGLLWWDLAVRELISGDQLLTAGGSIIADTGGVYQGDDGSLAILRPDQLDPVPAGFDVNAELRPRPRLG